MGISVTRNVLIRGIIFDRASAKMLFPFAWKRTGKNESVYKQSIARLKVYSELNSSNMIIAMGISVHSFDIS